MNARSRRLHTRRERRLKRLRDGLEYLMLRSSPRAWVAKLRAGVHSMWWQLQYGSLLDELDRRRLERAAATRSDPGKAHALIAFVYAGHSDWDTPNYSAEAPCVQAACTDAARVLTQSFPELLRFTGAVGAQSGEPAAPGSNNWAVAGIHTRSGVALIANDMHLDLGVPAVWYPARLRSRASMWIRRVTAGTPRWLPVPTPGGLDSPTVMAPLTMRAGQVCERCVRCSPRASR